MVTMVLHLHTISSYNKECDLFVKTIQFLQFSDPFSPISSSKPKGIREINGNLTATN